MTDTLIGVTGAPGRARVTAWGAVRFTDGRALEWWVAADDRWHVPSREPSRRQCLVEGTPVVETTLRVAKGDLHERVYAAVGGDGLVVIEVENASPLPLAVVVDRADVLSSRAPTLVPAGAGGADVPAHAVSFPIGHGATIRFALPLGRRPGPIVSLPSAREVARGWRRRVEATPRLVLPDEAAFETVVAARCRALLEDGPAFDDDPRGALVAASERERRREPVSLDALGIAAALERWARRRRRSTELRWSDAVMLERAVELLLRRGEQRAAEDARRLWARRPPTPRPADVPEEWWWRGAWVESGVARVGPDAVELLADAPASWFGQSIEAHDLPVGAERLSFAVRWHGARPALLWEASAPLHLTCSRVAPPWTTDRTRGEALLPPPAA